jgi:hypothetical protein
MFTDVRFRPVPVAGLFHTGNFRPYSITLSARTRTDCGILMPSAYAVLPLMINSNLTGCSTRRFEGFDARALDHFFVAGTGVISFAERGLL